MGSDVDLTDATAGGFVDLDVPVADKGRISPHQGDSAARADLRIVFNDRNTEREVARKNFILRFHKCDDY